MPPMLIDGSFKATLLIRGPTGVSTTVTDGTGASTPVVLFGDSTMSSLKTGVALGVVNGTVRNDTCASCAVEALVKPSRNAKAAKPTRGQRVILNNSRDRD